MSTHLRLPVLGTPTFESDLRDVVKEIRERNTRYAQDLLHKCYENVLFDYGRQWITFDNLIGQFRPKRTRKWVPKPVTNKFSAVMRPLISQLSGTDPVLQYAPTSEDPADVSTAQVASRIVEIARQETKVNRITPKLARWVGLTGNAWLIGGYDNDVRYGMVPEQAEQCVACGQSIMADDIEAEGGCPTCMKAGMESPGFRPAFDSMGQPIMGQRPRGALFTELGTPFEMEYDHEADSFEDSIYAMRMRSRDREWAKSHYNLSDEDLAGAGLGISPIVQQRYLQSLAFISPLSYQTYFAKPFRENRVLVTDLWIDPTEENPNGLYAVLIGDHIVYSGPYKYTAPESKPDAPIPMRTITHFGYMVAAGRVAYRTPADDLTSMQRTRNELESIYKLHSRRAANSILWVPDGTNLSKMTGEEGIVARYTAMAGVPPPHREQGLETPKFLENWITLLDQSMEIISGSVDVLRGAAPAGLEAYAALQALEAKAVQALAESRSLWFMAWAEWSRQMLGIFKQYAIDDRDFSMRGDNGAWSIEKFKAADLRGGVRIIPDLKTQPPSSPVAQAARVEQAFRIPGLVNPQDPNEKFRALQMIGVPEIMQDMEIDTRAAAIENDMFYDIFVKGGQGVPPNINPFIDNDPIHLNGHRRFALSDKGRQLGPIGLGALEGHMAQHEANMIRKMQAQQAQAQGGPSESKTVKSEGGAASQPERANDMGKPKQEQGKPQGQRATRVQQMRDEQNSPSQ